jgi:hypothetical protein
MSGAKNTVNMLLNIGGVEGTYRRIALGKITRQTILRRDISVSEF